MAKPVDQDQRDLITEVLDENVFVEAAAGTGKTTCLVGRMVNLIAEGVTQTSGIVAVTFTRKAAASLRLRFSLALESAAALATGVAAEHLNAAVRDVDQAFIGTIHSFCGRLLRERPFDAGVDPDFVELQEPDDENLRRRVWREYVETLLRDDGLILKELEEVGLKIGGEVDRPSGVLTDLDELGLEPAELGPAFLDAAAFPDVDDWPAIAVPMPGLDLIRCQIEEYVAHMESFEFPVRRGNDELMNLYESIVRKAQHTDFDSLPEFMDLVEQFRNVRTVQKEWPSKEIGKGEKKRYEAFLETTIDPLLLTWRQHRYLSCLNAIRPAVKAYASRRVELNSLNFADLLIKTVELLRTSPETRAWCRKRYPYLLVDEFQDTDPIQAEIMLLMTAVNPTESDWRRCCPVPGSLFVVGDPKQSIYRFRRADIQVFNLVRQIIVASGGRLAVLRTNFRSVPGVVDFANHAFEKLFPQQSSDFSPAHVHHEAFREELNEDAIQVLTIPSRFRYRSLVDENARQIAALISHELAQQRSIVRTKEEKDAGLPPHVMPSDYLLVGRYSRNFHVYENALRQAGVPCDVSGAGSMANCPELDLLLQITEAVTGPRSRIALLAVLRGFYGISDLQLYRYQSYGSVVRYENDPPDGLNSEDQAHFRSAFEQLRRLEQILRVHSPGRALRLVAEETGLVAHAAAADETGIQLGSFLKALDICSEMIASSRCFDVVTSLRSLKDQARQHDAVPALPPSESPVRLMTLHQCKGLEAGIVFLIDPGGEKKRPVTHHVSRAEQTQGFLPVYGRPRSQYGSRRLLAEPANWGTYESKERQFLAAEQIRLLYVAVTRARNRLVVSLPEKTSTQNPWEQLREFTVEVPDVSRLVSGEAPADVEPEAELPHEDVSSGTDPDVRWQQLREPGYELVAIKDSVLPPKVKEPRGDKGHGKEWGNLVHEVLDSMTKYPDADVASICEAAWRRHALPADWVTELQRTARVVRESDMWQRAQQSEFMMSEVPITVFDHEQSPPQMVRGVLDLVFQTSGGTAIVDYKSERVGADSLAELADYYAPQLRAYAKHWTEMTEDAVSEAGVFFTHTGQYVQISLESS